MVTGPGDGGARPLSDPPLLLPQLACPDLCPARAQGGRSLAKIGATLCPLHCRRRVAVLPAVCTRLHALLQRPGELWRWKLGMSSY